MGEAGTWAADTWTRLNTDHFDGEPMRRNSPAKAAGVDSRYNARG